MSVNIPGVKALLKSAFAELGHTATVTLHDGVTTFDIQITEGFRRGEDLTDGLAQSVHRIKILADSWDEESPGRPPEKGDMFVIHGHRRAVQGAKRVRGLGNDSIMYVLEMTG